ncbi:MAG: alpha/beta fold hydrolase [Planctomycetia bacterium]|nr:alpha/beta fold hydrolase [Planctomycetia bacterium]
MNRRDFLTGTLGSPVIAVLSGVAMADTTVNQMDRTDPGVSSGKARVMEREFIAWYDGSIQRYLIRYPGETDEVPEIRGASETSENTGNPDPGEITGTKTVDLLVTLHGHGADRNQFVYDVRDECLATRIIADRFGLLMVSPDYRARTSWMGPAAEADMVQLIGILRKEFPIRHVIFAGGSMGASSSLTFAAIHPELVDAVVAMNGLANHLEYENFQDAIVESFGGDKRTIPEEYRKRSAEYFPERFTVPLAVTTGGHDTLVPPDSVTRFVAILAKLGRPVVQIHRPEGGHETNLADAIAAYEFVLEKLRSESGNGESWKTEGN